jgi:hypothetical protein
MPKLQGGEKGEEDEEKQGEMDERKRGKKSLSSPTPRLQCSSQLTDREEEEREVEVEVEVEGMGKKIEPLLFCWMDQIIRGPRV